MESTRQGQCADYKFSGTGTTYDVRLLKPDTTYKIQVAAWNGTIATGSDVIEATTSTPIIRIGYAGGSSFIAEGTPAEFALNSGPGSIPVARNLPVNLRVTTVGDYGITAGSRTETIPAGQHFHRFDLQTDDDSVEEETGSVTVEILPGTGYRLSTRAGDKIQSTIDIISDDITRTVRENASPGTPVGSPLRSRDAAGARVTYVQTVRTRRKLVRSQSGQKR